MDTSHLAASLSRAIKSFLDEFRETRPTEHQINLFIAGWLLDNRCKIVKADTKEN